MNRLYYIIAFLFFSCQGKDKNAIITNDEIQGKQTAVDSFVFDNVGLLNNEQKKQLTEKLSNYYQQSNIAVLCVITKTIRPFEDEMDYGDFIIRSYNEEFE